MEADGVSVPVPPNEHPRLYLRAHDLADLKRRTRHPVLKPVWDEMQEAARSNVQRRLEVDAIQYLLTRDDDLGRRTLAAALETLTQARFDPKAQDVARPIGRLMVTGAVVYDWCYPLLTAAQKEAFLAQFLRLAKELECGYPPPKRSYLTGHFAEWMVMRDLLSAGIAVYDEFPEMYKIAANRVIGCIVPPRDWWNQGHAFHQGTSYSETRFSSDLYPLWIFDRLGAGNVYHPAQQFVPYQWIYLRRPDLQLLRAGDGQSRPPKLRSLLVASYYGDGYVLADYLKQPGIDRASQLFEFLWRDPDLPPRDISELPLTRYMGFPYGWMVARTGWDERSVIAEMKVNIYNLVNHQHLDAGSFQIYYQGPLAVDSGLYEGTNGAYGSPHHWNYYQRTIAHNSLLVYDPDEKFIARNIRQHSNDGGQRLPGDWREPGTLEGLLAGSYKTGEVLGHGFGPDPRRPAYSYLKGDLTAAYSAKVKQVKRSFVFLNLGAGPVPGSLIVFDKVVASNPSFKKYWLLHSMEEPVVQGHSTTVALTQRGWGGRLVNTTLMPEAGRTEINKVGGPGKEFWVFGENFPNQIMPGRNPNDYELGAWRVEVSPVAPAAADYFLNVMQALDRDAGTPLATAKAESGNAVIASVGDWRVVFDKSGGRATRPVAFTLDGGARLRCLVTDLAEGNWQLRRDGAIVEPAATVSAEAGTLYFEGPPGAYELRH
jgi:heparin/heparan-sulfate lyase